MSTEGVFAVLFPQEQSRKGSGVCGITDDDRDAKGKHKNSCSEKTDVPRTRKSFLKNRHEGAEEKGQWLKCLSCKYKRKDWKAAP